MIKIKKLTVLITILCIFCTTLPIPAAVSAAIELPTPVACYKFEGNGNDTSGNGNNASVVSTTGGTGITYVTGISGQGAKFDGSSFFEAPDSDILDLGKNYSFSVWICKEDIRPERYQPILEKRAVVDYEDNIAYGLADSENSETYIYFFDEYDNSSHAYSNTYLDFHKWQLLTVTNDGQYVRFYVDGVLRDNKQAVNHTLESTGPLVIGFSEYDDASFFKGVMDELMIFNTVLTPGQIKDYYTNIAAGTGKPLLDFGKKIAAQYKFNDNFADSSGNNQNGPINQVQGITFIQGKLGKAAKFNGAGMFEVPDSDLLDLGNSFAFTLWMCKEPNGEAPDYPILYKAKSSVGEGTEPGYALYESQGSTEVNFFDENRQKSYVGSESVAGAGKWYHLAVTCENGVMKFYYDGVLKDVKPFKGFTPHSSGSLFVGWNQWGNINFYKGAMDDLRIYNYALSATEVKQLAETTDKLTATPAGADALAANGSVQLKITLTSVETGAVTDVTAGAVYTTSDAKVAKVSKGNITGVAKGKATITVTYGPHTITVPVMVK
ncbi:MAG TPA: LamG-like jellyroll fold domain-containing protein [Candidatus Nitrosocosmicus sp.]|nr:LamG-like jellyroll fold domain-containing protein [Candidatus Nitrosocosmicus sp.]